MVTGNKDGAYEVILTKFPASVLNSENPKSILEAATVMEKKKMFDKQETAFQPPPFIIENEFSDSAGAIYIKNVIFPVES